MTADEPLVGRGPELALLTDLLDGVSSAGSAVVIDGDPGIGKTALVDEMARRALDRGMLVLRTTGTTSESGESYAALQMLLHPLRAEFGDLPAPQREALDVAFGLAAGSEPTPLLTGLAALTLLTDAASLNPLLVVAEDMHWVDSASTWAVNMVARRIARDPIVFMMTTRDPSVASAPEIRHLHLEPLQRAEANALLDSQPDAPRGRARDALLAQADGNPLALLELSRTGSALQTGSIETAGLLESAFAGRFSELGPATRISLLAMAFGDITSAVEAAQVAELVTGQQIDASWSDTAVEASLLTSTVTGLRFRHPLVRSAITRAGAPQERRSVLEALIEAYRDLPTRTVWWRAELAVAPDAALADSLEELAVSSLMTGDIGQAVRAYERSIALTIDPQTRAERLLDAAEAVGSGGAAADALRFLSAARADSDEPLIRARADWVFEMLPTPDSALSRRDIGPALTAIATMQDHGDLVRATDALLHLAAIVWDHAPDPVPGQPLTAAVSRLALDPDDPRAILLAAVTAPISRGDEVIARAKAVTEDDSMDPLVAWYLGFALNTAGEIDTAYRYLRKAAEGLRARGDTRLLPQVLMALSMTTYQRGRFTEARAWAEEVRSFAVDLGAEALEAVTRCCLAWFDALEGKAPDLEWITAGSPVGAQIMGSRTMRATFVSAEGISAVVAGRYASATTELAKLSDPADDCYSPTFAVLTFADFVEAAVASGDRPLAEQRTAEIERLGEIWHAPLIETALRFSRIALAADEMLPDLVTQLELHPIPMPYVHARAQLLLGTRLRRTQVSEARRLLRLAMEGFEALPAQAWAARAREALRASGERMPDAAPSSLHVLTPQELRIVTLAANGLSNRSIAESLFLSPRTIGAHLYSAFQKLGISSRVQLKDLLGPSLS